MRPREHHQKIWTLIFASASFVAALLAACFREAQVAPVYVAFVSFILAVGLGGIVALEVVIQRIDRRKR